MYIVNALSMQCTICVCGINIVLLMLYSWEYKAHKKRKMELKSVFQFPLVPPWWSFL